MKNLIKFLFLATFLMVTSFTTKQNGKEVSNVISKKDPVIPPYYSATAFSYPNVIPHDYVDVWVRWDASTVLSRDYYADVQVTYHDWCTTWTTTIHCIVPAGQFQSFTDIQTCVAPYIIDYNLVAWGPL